MTKRFETASNNGKAISSPEAFNAKPRSGSRKSSVVKKRAGKPRGKRSMGRFPFKAYVNRFFDETPYAASTKKEMRRRFERMEKDFLELVSSGKVKSANPEKISERDVLAYLEHLRDARKMRAGGILHNLDSLNSLLKFVGNASVETVKLKHKRMIPKANKQRLPSIKMDSVEKLREAASKVKANDWRRLEAYALVLASICTGARPKEIRLCKVSDLNTTDWVLHIEHVKGEGNWGEPRDSLVMDPAKDILDKYLTARECMVARYCPDNQALFPAIHDKGDGLLCGNSLLKLREIIKADTGISFDMRACRRTFGQYLINKGASVDTVSVLMGHASTKTTETYYCRKEQSAAIAEARRILTPEARQPIVLQPNDMRVEGDEKEDSPLLLKKSKSVLIETKVWVTGYA